MSSSVLPPRRVAARARSAAFLAGALAVGARSGRAQQHVFTFDVPAAELPALQTAVLSGAPVDGIRFDPASAWSVADWTNFARTRGFLFQCHTEPYCAAINGYASSTGEVFGQFSFVGQRQFFGAWLSGPPTSPDPFDPPNTLSWQLLVGSQVVYTSPIFTPSIAPAFYGVSYTGPVDAVRLSGPLGYVLVDDITFGPAASVVPEPATIALVGAGLITLSLVARRRART